jgi:hypothetical protein
MYRIQIDELVNGEKRFSPQVGRLHISGKWIMRSEIVWDNLVNQKFFNESDAMMVIKEHKRLDEIKKGNEVFSTKYKLV